MRDFSYSAIFSILTAFALMLPHPLQAQTSKIDCDFVLTTNATFAKFQTILDNFLEDTKPTVKPDGILKICVESGRTIHNVLSEGVPSIKITRDNVHIEGLGPEPAIFKNLLHNTPGSGNSYKIFEVIGASGVQFRNLQLDNISSYSQSILVKKGGNVELIDNIEFTKSSGFTNAQRAIVLNNGSVGKINNVRISLEGINLTGIHAIYYSSIGLISNSRVYVDGGSVSGIKVDGISSVEEIDSTTALAENTGPFPGPGNPLVVTASSIATIRNSHLYSNYPWQSTNASWAIKMHGSDDYPAYIGEILSSTGGTKVGPAILLSGNSVIKYISPDSVFVDFWNGEF